jgi:hypothetical protein
MYSLISVLLTNYCEFTHLNREALKMTLEVEPCHGPSKDWVISSRCFEGALYVDHQGYRGP